MTDFAVFLGEKVERYIELRRALGYAFEKQAGTLRAFVRHIERRPVVRRRRQQPRHSSWRAPSIL
jgi:hypothetical protein